VSACTQDKLTLVALPVAILSYLFYGFKYKSWFIKAEDVDLVTETRLKIETLDEDNLVEPHSVKRGFMKAIRVFWTD
jgi:amino acid permease